MRIQIMSLSLILVSLPPVAHATSDTSHSCWIAVHGYDRELKQIWFSEFCVQDGGFIASEHTLYRLSIAGEGVPRPIPIPIGGGIVSGLDLGAVGEQLPGEVGGIGEATGYLSFWVTNNPSFQGA